jgi:hypothetical protein
MRKPSAVALIAATALLLAVSVADARVLAKGSSSGDYAIAQVSVTDSHPGVMQVKVTSVPNQSALVTWDMVCSHGLSAGSKMGQFTARTPIVRTMAKPMAHPTSCIISASAQIQGASGGVVRVFILD